MVTGPNVINLDCVLAKTQNSLGMTGEQVVLVLVAHTRGNAPLRLAGVVRGTTRNT